MNVGFRSLMFLAGMGLSASVLASGPVVDHHQHLLSPAAASMLGEAEGQGGLKPMAVPADVAALLQRRAAAWNDAKGLSDLYTKDAILVEDAAVSGREAVIKHVSERFGRPYAVTPLAYADDGDSRQVAAAYTRGEGEARTNVGLTLLTLRKDADGRWRIAGETMKFPGPQTLKAVDAAELIGMLDQAEIDRAVVMSVAYFFESPLLPKQTDAAASLRAENDWTAAEVARFPGRLVAFCGINPLSEQALTEVRRCKDRLGMKGLKLHFGNSVVDLKQPAHLARMRAFFAEANRLRMPIAAHLWSGANEYGRRDAELFLAELLPVAPDIVVQVMHMAGAGPGWTDEALEVLARAVEAKDPRTSKLFFDVATVAELQTHAQLQLLAKRIRQIGPQRILYGSDAAFGGRNTPDQGWGIFRGMVPLTDAEFAIIRANIAPYLR